MSDCSYLEHKHIHQWSKLMKMGSNPISKCVQNFWKHPAKFWKIERKMIGSKGKSFKILRKKLPWAQMFQILAAFRLFFLSPKKQPARWRLRNFSSKITTSLEELQSWTASAGSCFLRRPKLCESFLRKVRWIWPGPDEPAMPVTI